ncbi:MAG: hypothetical protein HYV34_01310 [Candidatus Kerfeldbacteria bacterium]|nr:hypothetical protein [Candidatus Kerfeldbacteria bacterium]
MSETSVEKIRTSLGSRVIFGVIAAIWISSFLKMIYLFSLGRNVPPFSGWIFLLPTIIGLLLVTLKGNIRLRLHSLGTPIGLLMVFWAWLVLWKVDVAAVNGNIFQGMTSQSSEVYLFITGFGLFLAFIDTKAIFNYAYWFAPLAIFNAIFFVAALYALFTGKNILPALPLDEGDFFFTWGRIIEAFLWYSSGLVFGYSILQKFKTDRPTLKVIGFTIGKFVIVIILLIIIGSVIGNALPKDYWFGRWLRSDQPIPPSSNQENGQAATFWPANMCPDAIENKDNPDRAHYAIKNNERYLLDEPTDIWVKENCAFGEGAKQKKNDEFQWSTMREGPYRDTVSYATGTSLTTWEDSKIILAEHASVPDVIMKDGILYVYFVDVSTDGIAEQIGLITSSDNGKTWSEKTNISITGLGSKAAVDPSPYLLDDGRIRLYYFDISTTRTQGLQNNTIYSAISSDGMNFTEEPGKRFTYPAIFDPSVIMVGSTWRMYVGTDDQKVLSATSTDGLTFTYEGVALTQASIPDVVYENSTYYLFTGGIETATSKDGKTFTKTGDRFDSGALTADPGVVKLSDGSYFMVFKTKPLK